MGIITLNKQNRLFWLGRYSERVYSTIKLILKEYDHLLDGASVDYEAFCRKMGIPCIYTDSEDFLRRYLFDPSSPFSVRSSIEAMLGNGMMLRETISSITLSYLQMARNSLLIAENSDAPYLELQLVLDDIMAFRGSFDEYVDDESNRNITKVGALIERLSIYLRFEWQTERLEKEIGKLLARLQRTDIAPNAQALAFIKSCPAETLLQNRLALLNNVERLFLV